MGIKISRGRYIGFLDADDSYSKQYVEEMFELARKNGVSVAPTHVFKNDKRIKIFRGNNKNFLTIKDISDTHAVSIQ